MKQRTIHLHSGFTLVELLVAMAIFTVVITIATGALFSAQSINTRLEQTQKVLDGVNLATEVIARDIRYGSDFYCTTNTSILSVPVMGRQDCIYPSGGTILMFRPATALLGSQDKTQDRIAYYLLDGAVYKREFPYGGQQKTYQITSNEVTIDSFLFFSKGAFHSSWTPPDYIQPLVTMAISGVTQALRNNVQPVTFTIQTSTSARALDK